MSWRRTRVIQNSKLEGHPSSDEPSELAAVGALVVVGALVIAILMAFANPDADVRYAVRQAAALLEEGRYSEAVAAYERILPTYDAPEVRLGLSYAYLARRDGERAARQALNAAASAPADYRPAARAQLGRVFAAQGRYGEAVQAWSRAVEAASTYPGNPLIEAQARSSLWHLAMHEWSTGEFESARARFESLQDGDDIYAISARIKLAQLFAPEDEQASRKLVSSVARNFQVVESVASTANPKSKIRVPFGRPKSEVPPAVPNLRVPGLREGLSTAAITGTIEGLRDAFLDVGRARGEGVDAPGMAALWGRAFLQQGEPYLAERYLEQAVAARPELADAHSYLALALLEMGDLEEAAGHLERAVALAPQRPLPHHLLARLSVQLQEWDRALAELGVLRRLEPDGVQTHLQLAEYYLARGAYDAAEEEYIAAVENQQGESGDTNAGDAALSLARFYTDRRGQGCENGLPAAQESLARHQGDPASLDAVGWALVLCAKPAEALSSLESAVTAAPDVARFRYHLGRAYALLGRTDDAREQFVRATDLDPGGRWEGEAKAAMATLSP